ncbi:HU family DNA-binding protein [Candidatus Phytoplasma oryzae]|nr:HU family DNA-binding protein [Candidatus Phytoplasma oryzae]
MTKLELINLISKKTKMTKKEANVFFDHLNEIIIESLNKNEKVPMPGLGIIQLRDRKAKDCKLPNQPEPRHVPAHVVPVLRMSKKIKSIFKIEN